MKSDKEAMIKAIKEAADHYQPPPKKTEFEKFLCTTYLKPVDKSSKSAGAMETGSHNEQNIIHDLRRFLEGSNVIELASDPIEFGLVARKSKPFLATSVDGLAVDASIFVDTGDRVKATVKATVALEFKTLSSRKTIDDFKTALAEVNPESKDVLQCQFGDDTFKKVVSNTGYRVQVLHHAMVLELDHVLFCVATSTSLVCCLLIEFVKTQRDAYESILSNFAGKHLQCIYGDERFPNINEENISSGKYRVEADTVQLNYKLWKALNKLVLHHDRPIPATKFLLPKIVRQWNLSKGMVDVISRYLRHLHIPFKAKSPSFALMIRLLLLPAINGCLTDRLQSTADKCIVATSFVHYKKQMANERTLKCYMEELATHFRLRMRDRGAELKSDARTHFSPEGPGRKRNNMVLYQALDADIADFEQKMRASKQSNRTFDSVKFFVDEPAAKKVRLDRQQGHMCVCLDGRPGLVIERHADCDTPSEQSQPAFKGRCALCSARSCRYGCKVCRVRLCVVLRDDDTGQSCAEKWHDPDCDLKSEKKHSEERSVGSRSIREVKNRQVVVRAK
jgi:hypothetical protein